MGVTFLSFLWLNNIPLCVCTPFCLPHSSVVSIWLLWMLMLWIWVCKWLFDSWLSVCVCCWGSNSGLLCMLGKHSVAELHPSPLFLILQFHWLRGEIGIVCGDWMLSLFFNISPYKIPQQLYIHQKCTFFLYIPLPLLLYEFNTILMCIKWCLMILIYFFSNNSIKYIVYMFINNNIFLSH